MSVNLETRVPSLTASVTVEGNTDLTNGDRNPADKVEKTTSSLDDDWKNDPVNPKNWPIGQKWLCTAIVSLYTFVSPLGSSMMASGLPEVATNYNITNPTVIALTLSIFLLSFAIGPLIWAPLSEMYGRTWVLHIGNITLIAFTLGCAFAPTAGALIGLRFLCGLSGSVGIGIGGGSIADMFVERDRGTAMSVYVLGPLFGPVIGPIAGGFVTQNLGVKWVFIIIAIICGATSLLAIPFLRETYAPVIRRRRAAKLGDLEKAAEFDQPAALREGKLYYLWINLSRPFVMLFRSLICFLFSLYLAFLYGIFYLMLATFADIFTNVYGFGVGTGGLAYIGLGVGFIGASLFGSYTADQIYKHLADKNGGVGTPEMRIPALFIGSLFVPIGLFWFGWSAAAGVQWIMPIIGTAIFSFGLLTVFLPIQLYLVDSFIYAASVTSASGLFRSLFGFAFPLFSEQMFAALGLGGGNSLLAGFAIVLGIPFPIWIYYKGEEMRARNPLTQASAVLKKKRSSQSELET